MTRYLILFLLPLQACGSVRSVTDHAQTSATERAENSANNRTESAMDRATAGPPEQLLRDQMQPLRGMTVAEAKKRLKDLGHDGKVIVGTVLQFDSTCGENKVCETNRDGGMGIHDDIELHLNPKLVISTPP